nr:MAG TPA: hypothetical protein [Bacteriophage sp.]
MDSLPTIFTHVRICNIKEILFLLLLTICIHVPSCRFVLLKLGTSLIHISLYFNCNTDLRYSYFHSIPPQYSITNKLSSYFP